MFGMENPTNCIKTLSWILSISNETTVGTNEFRTPTTVLTTAIGRRLSYVSSVGSYS